MNKKVFFRLIILLIFSFNLFIRLYNLGKPASFFFDEQVYIYSARTVFGNAADGNHEYPPLGKTLNALSMKTFGDNPSGWRSLASIFNFASVTVSFFILRELIQASGGSNVKTRTSETKSELSLLLGTLIITSDPFILAVGRVAAIDNYLIFFTIASFYFLNRFIFASNTPKETVFQRDSPENKISLRKLKIYLILSAIFFGLALSVKLSAAFLLPGVLLALFITGNGEKNISRLNNIILFGFISICAYLTTYIVYFQKGYPIGYPFVNILEMKTGLANARGNPSTFFEALGNTFFWYFPKFGFLDTAKTNGLASLWGTPSPFVTLSTLCLLPYFVYKLKTRMEYWLSLPIITYFTAWPLAKAAPQGHYGLVTILPMAVLLSALINHVANNKHIILRMSVLIPILSQIFFLVLVLLTTL